MKKAILLLICSMLGVSAISQKVIKRAVDEMCDCFNKIDPELEDPAALDEEAAECFQTIAYHMGDLKKKGYDILTDEGMEQVIELIMLEALEACPKIITIAAQLQDETEVKYNKTDTVSPELCQTFRSGKYLLNNEKDSALVIMDNTTQTYQDLKSDDTNIYELEWLSDCEYLLKYKGGNDKQTKEIFQKIDHIKYTIVAMDEERIVFYAEILGVPTNTELKILE